MFQLKSTVPRKNSPVAYETKQKKNHEPKPWHTHWTLNTLIIDSFRSMSQCQFGNGINFGNGLKKSIVSTATTQQKFECSRFFSLKKRWKLDAIEQYSVVSNGTSSKKFGFFFSIFWHFSLSHYKPKQSKILFTK